VVCIKLGAGTVMKREDVAATSRPCIVYSNVRWHQAFLLEYNRLQKVVVECCMGIHWISDCGMCWKEGNKTERREVWVLFDEHHKVHKLMLENEL